MRIYEAFNEFYALYVKEKNLNTIQEYNVELIDEIKRFLSAHRNFLNTGFQNSNNSKKKRKLNIITDKSCYFELYTLRYYFSEYFRIRISKIESLVCKQQIISFTDQIEFLKNLSHEERDFCKDYVHLTNDGLMKAVKPSDDEKDIVKNICNTPTDSKYDFVFVKATTSLNNVEIKVDGNLQEVDIEKGDVFLCRLAAVIELINNGSLEMF